MKNITIGITDCNHGYYNPEILASKEMENKYSIHINLIYLNCSSEKEVIEKAKECDIIITQRRKIDGDIIDCLPKCKIVVRYGVGLDNIDVDAMKLRGISVINFPQFCTNEVANHTLALVMYAYRKLYSIFDQSDLKDHWGKPSLLNGVKSAEQTSIGIIGLGRIGIQVARRLISCGFNVFAFDPYISDDVFNKENVIKTNIKNIFSYSDIVSLHCPLNNETFGMINKKLFDIMKDDSAIINTSRGQVINQQDLIESLNNKHPKIALIDVCDPEPCPNDILLNDSIFVTPHIAFYSEQSLAGLKRDVIIKSVEKYHELQSGSSIIS